MAHLPTTHDPSWVVVGKIGAPHGVQGGLKIYSFTLPLDNLLSYKPWYVAKAHDHQWTPMSYTRTRPQNDHFVVHFDSISTREAARTFTHALIAIPRSALPPLPVGEYYWNDLEGLMVLTNTGISLGKIIHIETTGANDVLWVEGERLRLIPYLIQQVIVSIDLDSKTMIVHWDPDF